MIDYILLEFYSKYVEMIPLIIPSIIESHDRENPHPFREYLFTFVLNFPPFKKFKNNC
jgi:hypothetical protein